MQVPLLKQCVKRLETLSIHAKMTLWYTLIFTLLIVLFGTIFYLHLRSGLADSFDTQLSLRAQIVSRAITEQHGALTLHDESGRLLTLIDTDDPAQKSKLNDEQHLSDSQLDPDLDTLIQVRNPAGQIQYSTPAFMRLAPPASNIAQAEHGSTQFCTFSAGNGQHIRLYSEPIFYNHATIGVVLIGMPLSSLENTLQHVFLELLLIGPIILLLGIVGSFWLARRALRPVTHLTKIAHTIQQGDLHSRVPVPYSNDEIHVLAETFNEMIDHIEKLFYQQRRFLSDASHELRTPVAALRSITDVALQQQRSVEEYEALLQSINGQTEQLGHLITGLLTLARADEGEIHLERENVCLEQIANGVISTLEPLIEEKEIAFDVHYKAHAHAIGDEARLMQVVMNLLNNAITYTAKGDSITLTIDTTGTHALLQVQDTGIGIATKHIPHIFERFYRIDNARSRKIGGTGLGLAITQWIVHMHQGTITVESQPGKGSLFTVSLPLAQTEDGMTSSYSHQCTLCSLRE